MAIDRQKKIGRVSKRDPNTYEFDVAARSGNDRVRVGGDNPAIAEPKVKIGRFSNARKPTDLELELLDFTIGEHRQNGGKVEFDSSDKRYDIYGLEPADISPVNTEGGVELELVLKTKPITNIFSWKVEGVKHLNWRYQSSMIDENGSPEVVSKTETQHLDISGNVIAYRPENVVGSYAVYYNNPSDSIDKNDPSNKQQFGGGKAFHVFRPRVIDDNGNEVWGTLSYSDGVISIEVDSNWLDNANYPVKIDPTFGYETIGSSETYFNKNYSHVRVCKQSSTESADVIKLTAACKLEIGSSVDMKGVIYDDSGGTPDNRKDVGAIFSVTDYSYTWYDSTLSVSLVGTGPWHIGLAVEYTGDTTGDSTSIAYDAGSTNQLNVQYSLWDNSVYLSPPDPFGTPSRQEDREYSLYAVYLGDSSLEVSGGTYNVDGSNVDFYYFAANPVHKDFSFEVSGNNVEFLVNYTLNTDSASYLINGTDTDLVKDSVFSVDEGLLNCSGQNADLLVGRDLGCFSTTYLINGVDSELLYGSKLDCDGITYNISGQDANLLAGRNFNCSETTYLIDGTNVNLIKDTIFSIESGALNYSGQNADLLVGRDLGCSSTTYLINGSDSELFYGSKLNCNSTTYSISGQEASLLIGRSLQCPTTTYLINGTNAGLYVGRNLEGVLTTYLIEGQDVTFLHGSVLECDSGTYNINGTNANLEAGKELAGESGSLLISGTEVNFLADQGLQVDSGQILINGMDANLLAGYQTEIDSGTYLISGTDVNFEYFVPDSTLADTGTYNIVGGDANFVYGLHLNSEPTTYTIDGTDADLDVDKIFSIDPGTVLINGTDAELVGDLSITAGSGIFEILGALADLTYGKSLKVDSGTYTINGEAVGFIEGYILHPGKGTFTISGNSAGFSRPARIRSLVNTAFLAKIAR